MNVALFGGTFDPIHRGHLAVARAAAERFNLAKIYFVPADIPPHKQRQPITPYYHRYAMVALALAEEKNFVPSLLEAPEVIQAEGKIASYSIDSVRRFKKSLKKNDPLFFIIGIDAFMDIAKWRTPVELLHECEFIVASRPGYSLTDVAKALPESMRPREDVMKAFRSTGAHGSIALPETTIHLLEEVKEPVSATKIRAAAAAGKSVEKMVGPAVAAYIKKEGLYRTGAPELLSPEEEQARLRQQEQAEKSRAGLRVVGGHRHKKDQQ
jgi:nicotinate-nucleotide adenylyltransferase